MKHGGTIPVKIPHDVLVKVVELLREFGEDGINLADINNAIHNDSLISGKPGEAVLKSRAEMYYRHVTNGQEMLKVYQKLRKMVVENELKKFPDRVLRVAFPLSQWRLIYYSFAIKKILGSDGDPNINALYDRFERLVTINTGKIGFNPKTHAV